MAIMSEIITTPLWAKMYRPLLAISGWYEIHYEYICYVATVAILHFDGQIFIVLYENLLC